MSYDYMLARGDAGDDMEGFSASAEANLIGPVEPLKAALSRQFPTLEWRLFETARPDGNAGTSWFGMQGPPEFQLLVEPGGDVRVIRMSHCERTEVEQVARELGLAAFDMQTMEVFGG